MVEKQIDLLNKQIEKLDDEQFDLEGWKGSTIVLLERFFGTDSQKVKQVENIRLDFGSWSLRDSNARVTPLEACKRRSKEIVESIISELENFGLPASSETLFGNVPVSEALEEELKVAQIKKIHQVVASERNQDEKAEQIRVILDDLDQRALANILTHILIRLKAQP